MKHERGDIVKRKNIMHFRIDKGLTKAQLGEHLGVTGQYISKIENCNADGGKKFWQAFKEKFNLSDEEINHLKEMEK